MKIGIVCCAYNCAEGLENRLIPFKRDNFKISVINAPFVGYDNINQDNTIDELKKLHDAELIDYLTISRSELSEAEARNLALNEITLRDKVDYIWLLDASDEYYIDKEILNIIKYVESKPEIAWFSLNFKNYVFTKNQWIDGFCPPRIFKCSTFNGNSLTLGGFYFDNDVYYLDLMDNKIDYKKLSNQLIPRRVAHISHYSWLNCERSKSKINYQERRWGKDSCSYKWNDQKNQLEFNEIYYKNLNFPPPEIFTEE